MHKNFLRTYIRKLRDNIEDENRNIFNERIYKTLISNELYKNSKAIYAYMSFDSEVDTVKLSEHILNNNKELYLPRINGKDMDFYKVNDLSSLVKSKFGLLEPDDDDNNIDKYIYSKKDKKLMIIPGIAFDLNGNRIGYGGGYYDKFLNKYNDSFIKVAIAYDIQLVNHINNEGHDIKVDYILTNKGLLKCN
ncbi:MAG TPA: 5-formyltetrahydrofolate cyclo-ligase [Clostridiales bacterium]|nr:5-formyltetrahydrofolate cyclo-ligase [Clostridiales bacterium]